MWQHVCNQDSAQRKKPGLPKLKQLHIGCNQCGRHWRTCAPQGSIMSPVIRKSPNITRQLWRQLLQRLSTRKKLWQTRSWKLKRAQTANQHKKTKQRWQCRHETTQEAKATSTMSSWRRSLCNMRTATAQQKCWKYYVPGLMDARRHPSWLTLVNHKFKLWKQSFWVSCDSIYS